MAKEKDPNERRTVPLHIFYMKDAIVKFEDAVKVRIDKKPTISQFGDDDLGFSGALYTFPESPTEPGWQKFLKQAFPQIAEMENIHHSAILFIQNKKGRFAITFGYAHHKLNMTSFVRDFGKRVVVNMVKPDSVSSMNTQDFEAVSISRSEEATRATSLQRFGIDVEQELLKALSGVPEDEKFAKTIAGSDGFKMTASVNFKDLGVICARLAKEHKSKAYLTNGFDWIDNLQIINDSLITDVLEQLLVADLKSAKTKVQLSAPDSIRDEVGHFAYSKDLSQHFQGAWLLIEDLKEMYKHDIAGNLETRHMKQWQVDSYRENDASYITTSRVFELFLFEVEHQNEQYVLHSGKWYRAAKSFIAKLDAYLKKVEVKPSNLLSPVAVKVEQDYINQYATNSQFTTVHGVKDFPINGSTIEACDLFDHSGRMIHVKRWKSSSTFSHLLGQGLIAAITCEQVKEFRDYMIGILPKGHSAADYFGPNYLAPKLTVAFALLRKSQRPIPFFSKLNLYSNGTRIRRYGFQVEFHVLDLVVQSGRNKGTKKVKKKP